MPGLFRSQKHLLENRTVTFGRLGCPRAFFCHPSYDLLLYDGGLYPAVTLSPSCTVVDAVVGLKWYWRASLASVGAGAGHGGGAPYDV